MHLGKLHAHQLRLFARRPSPHVEVFENCVRTCAAGTCGWRRGGVEVQSDTLTDKRKCSLALVQNVEVAGLSTHYSCGQVWGGISSVAIQNVSWWWVRARVTTQLVHRLRFELCSKRDDEAANHRCLPFSFGLTYLNIKNHRLVWKAERSSIGTPLPPPLSRAMLPYSRRKKRAIILRYF